MGRAYEQKVWTGQGKTDYCEPMAKNDQDRAERLAAALRENLRKRKSQDKTPPAEKPQRG
jgi:hypothetical protein